MKDTYGREINYLRISITDRCNLRCTYCMPKGITTVPMSEILTYEEILSVCRAAVSLGITRFKITGGEPLVRLGCITLIRRLRQLPGVEQVTMTTNGLLLEQSLDELVDAGLDGVNISLDTLDPIQYNRITGFWKNPKNQPVENKGSALIADQNAQKPYAVGRDTESHPLATVLSSIDAALEKGLPVKLNAVLREQDNAEAWESLLDFVQKRPLPLRFIELMPMGYSASDTGISNRELFQKITKKYGSLKPDCTHRGNGPAVYYRIPGFSGSIGFISPIHGCFCASCNRLRLTSTGELRPCLGCDAGVDLREALRSGDEAQVRQRIQRAILAKPAMHHFEAPDATLGQEMAKIGG